MSAFNTRNSRDKAGEPANGAVARTADLVSHVAAIGGDRRGMVEDADLRAGAARLASLDFTSAGVLALHAGAVPAEAALVLDWLNTLLYSGRNRELRDSILLLPPEMRDRPLFAIWSAFASLPQEPAAVRDLLAEIRRALSPNEAPVEYVLALSGEVQATLSEWSDYRELPPLIEEIDRVQPGLVGLPAALEQRLNLVRCMAMLLGWPTHPHIEAARRQIETVLPRLTPGSQLLFGSVLMNYLIWWRGNLTAARPYLEALEVFARRGDMPPLAVMAWYYGALSFAYREGALDRLQQLTDDAVAFAEQHGVSHRLSNAFWVVAQAYADAGDFGRAGAAITRYVTSAPERWRRADLLGAHYLRAVVALCESNPDKAIAEAMHGHEYAERYGGPHQAAHQAMVLARATAMKGDEQALAHIEHVRHIAERTDNANFRIQAAFAEAALAHVQGRRSDFATAWRSVVEIALQLGWRQMTGMQREITAELANDALGLGAGTETRRLIALWQLVPPRNGVVHETWPYPVRIRSLGGFEIHVDGRRLEAQEGKAPRKPLELLWHLLAQAQDVPQEALADWLWPTLDGDRAMHALRTTIYRLRLLIGSKSIRHENDHIGLNADHVRTDLRDLRLSLDAVADAAAPEARRLDALDATLRLYHGLFLPGIRLEAIEDVRRRTHARVKSECVGLLLAQDSRDPATVLRASRLSVIAPEITWPTSFSVRSLQA
jgi:tetratricopeptide (TPR) repeat protein